MPYTTPHTWVAGDFLRASWLNLTTTDLVDHETRILALEGGGGGASELSELTDVALGSPISAGEALVYNGSVWTNQTAATSLTWQGAWDGGTAYVADDLVEHNGSAYIATTATTGDEPGVASPDPWDLVAEKGDTGATGASGPLSWEGAWDNGTAYAQFDLVQHNGSAWIASTATTGDEPGVASPDPWDLVAAKGDTGSAGVLNDLTDVSVAAPNDGDVLTYQAGSPTGWIAAASSGGGAWSLVDSWTHAGDVANVDFDVTGYQDILIMAFGITTSSSAQRGVQLSIDGASYLTGASDYVNMNPSGNPTTASFFGLHETATTGARSGMMWIGAMSLNGVKKPMAPWNRGTAGYCDATTSPIVEVRVMSSVGNFTAGSIVILGKQ